MLKPTRYKICAASYIKLKLTIELGCNLDKKSTNETNKQSKKSNL